MTETTSAEAAVDKKEWATRVVYDILALMEVPARLDVKDVAEGGISIALHLDGELPGLTPGKRSHVLEALQFVANKVVNRPNTERRWISLGVGAHPEPRPAPGQRAAAPAKDAPLPSSAGAPAPSVKPSPRPPSARASGSDEKTLEVSEDAALSVAVRSLAERSAALGRYYALAGMKLEDRARVYKSVGDVAGVKVRLEGEGRNRRVVFHPDKPAPMPKRTHPNFDDEEEDFEEA